MKPLKSKSSFFIKKGGELSVSGSAFTELLQAVLKKGVPIRFRTNGSSMSPFIKDNDVITLSPLSNTEAQIGDAVAYISPRNKHLVIHRVIGKRKDFFIIKGDNTIPKAYEVTPKNNILGFVTKVERNGKELY